MSLIFPKKEILYAPMLGTLGGGSARGMGRGLGRGRAKNLGEIFGATNVLTFSWSNDFTIAGELGDWSIFPNGADCFCSGIRLYSASNFSVPDSSNANNFNSPNPLSSVTAPQGSGVGFTVSDILQNNNGSGAWLESTDSRTLRFVFNSNIDATSTPSKSVLWSGYSTGNHHPAIFKLTGGNGIARMFAFPHVGTPKGTTFQYFPLTEDFQSFNDARFLGLSGTTFNPSYFEYNSV